MAHPAPGRKMGPPVEGAHDAVLWLRSKGHQLIVFTQRGGDPVHVQEWLAFFDFPPLRITNIKGDYDILLDDKAVRFTSWPAFQEFIERAT